MKKGYKHTDIGVIPSDWEVKKLGEFSEVKTGSTPPTNDRSNYGDEYFFVSPADLGKGKYIVETEKKLSSKGFGISRVYPKNSILFTCIGSTIGKSGIAKMELTSNQQINAILPNENYITDFVFYSLSFLTPKIKASASEQAVPLINKTEFETTLIPLPPTLAEQTAIATALSDADALISQLEKLIAKKRAIKQGAMQDLLTGKKRLPNTNGDWIITKLKNIVEQFIVPMRDKPKKFNGDIPWCRIEDFEGKYIFDSKSKQYVDKDIIIEMNLRVHPKETLLVSCSADLGRCAIVKKPLVTNQTFIGLVVNETTASNEFLYYYMIFNADELNNLSSGTTISYLSREQFEEFKIYIPKSKEVQTRIATILSDMDAEIEVLEKKLDKYKLLKQGMMQELLTGRIRLV